MEKILIFNSALSRGGAERVTVYLAEYFYKRNIACEIITSSQAEHEYEVPSGVTRTVLTSKGYFSKVAELRKLIKKSGAQVLLTMGVSNDLYTVPATIGLPIKNVISERNDPRFFAGKGMVKIISRFFMKFASGYVFQTREARDFYSKKIASRSVIIPNPLFTAGLPSDYPDVRKKVLVSVGRLHKQKNQKMLIESFSAIAGDYPEFKLIIYGEGGLRSELEAQISSKGLTDRIILPGNSKQVLDEIKDCYAFVLSSDYEGMPNALIEAMAIGLPCISTACSGVADLIQNGENGLIVPVGATDSLSFAIKKVLDNPDLAKTMGDNAKNIRQVLDSDVIGFCWLEYFMNLDKGKSNIDDK